MDTYFEEGLVSFRAPKGKISSALPAFYNPDKKFDRDLTIEILNEFSKNKKELVLCDLLSATGIRALRFSSEVKNVKEVYAFEKNPVSFKYILGNILRNKKKLKAKIFVQRSDANKALYETGKMFDYIDIDPFGSPNPFLCSALEHIKTKDGLLGITATDSAALAGTYPSATMRKYQSLVFKTPYYRETGLRILIKKIIQAGAEKETALTPVFAYSRFDYYRTYFLTDSGAGRCDRLLEQCRYFLYNKKTMKTEITEKPKQKAGCVLIGPLFTGKLWDDRFIAGKTKMAETIRQESKIDVPYYAHIPSLYKGKGKSMPSFEKIMNEYRKKGKKVSRTHFDPEGLRISL